MTPQPSPQIGDWYKSTAGDAFEVVASDDDDETLELQYYDGTIEELDRETRLHRARRHATGKPAAT